jgi:hypothetical protein
VARAVTAEEVTMACNATDDGLDALTFAACMITRGAQNFSELIVPRTSGGARRLGWGYVSDQFYIEAPGTATYKPTNMTKDVWGVWAFTKPAGTSWGGWHQYLFGTNTWTHETPSFNQETQDQSSVGAGGHFGLFTQSDGSERWVGDIAAVMYLPRQMTDSEIRRLPAGRWAHQFADSSAFIVEFPAGRDAINVISDISRHRCRQSSLTGTPARYNGVGPPGFAFSAHNRRR